jgi:rubrerythrin
MFVLDCANPCRFLGGYENEPQQVEPEKTKNNSLAIGEKKTEENKTENASVTFCSICNVKMSQTKTNFKIDGWKESNQKFNGDDSARNGGELLPVIVYLCQKCGNISFRADEKLIRK